jgi:cytochrome c-type biogenesis protein CcmH
VTPLVLVLAGMTVVVLLAVLLPLLHGWRAPAERRQFDRAVYRAQLDELGRDIARGIIGGTDAQTARLEIKRRLLAADAASTATGSRLGSSRALAIASALIICGGAGMLYLWLGAPGVPDVPFAERHEATPAKQEAHVEMADAATALAARLRTNPTDAQGWLFYARTEATLGNWAIAADAFQHALALGQTSADVQSAYGEMQVLAADGIVGPPARTAFTAALHRDKTDVVARYYLALADAQAGESRRAIAAWLDVAADLPEGSPMREAVQRRITDAANAANIPVPPMPKGQPLTPPAASDATSGPSSDQIADAANMPPAERDKMIRGMVAQLAAKMAHTPDDVDGWMRLGRAYAVLGDTDKAADAYDRAAKLRPDDTDIPVQEVEALLSNRKPDDVIPARAVTLLKQVAAASPDRPEVLWYLGVVAARAGQRDEAKAEWQHLLTLLPPDSADHKTVAEALQAIDKP